MEDDRQGDLFRSTSVLPPPKCLDYPPPRPPGPARAGTIITHALARKVFGTRPKRKSLGLMGYVDPTARVFQSGGELHTRPNGCTKCGHPHGGFYYYAEDLITLADDIWQQITGPLRRDIDAIEMVDNCSNTVFRIPLDLALREAHWYHNKLGKRWGVDFDRWERLPYTGPRVRFETDD